MFVHLQNKKYKVFSRKEGFSLVEIMIVLMIIGILVAIIIPSWSKFRKYSQRNICIANLKELFEAAQIYALENRKDDSFIVYPTYANIEHGGLLPYLKRVLKCPTVDEFYKEFPVGTGPTCPGINLGYEECTSHVLP